MHIVVSITDLAVTPEFNRANVLKNNQNNGDFITSTSSISVFTCVPGNSISTHKTRQLVNMIKSNPIFRQLYLSVMAPIIGRTNNAGIVSNVKTKPTITDEYPRCFDIVDKNGIIGAEPK